MDPRVSPWAQVAAPSGFAPIERGGTNSGTAVGARGQLGLGTIATRDAGTANGDVPVLTTGGLLAAARMGSGSASISRFLRGDKTWSDPRPTTASQAEAEAGTSGSIRSWTPVRVAQAIGALAGDGTGSGTAGAAGAPGWSAAIDAAYRDPDSGVLPQFEIIVLSGGRRIIEFDHLNADDNRYITEMIEGTIIQIGEHGGDRFTVDATGYNEHTNGQHRITGTFENTTHPTLTNGDDYRVLFTQARKGADGADGDAAGRRNQAEADGRHPTARTGQDARQTGQAAALLAAWSRSGQTWPRLLKHSATSAGAIYSPLLAWSISMRGASPLGPIRRSKQRQRSQAQMAPTRLGSTFDSKTTAQRG